MCKIITANGTHATIPHPSIHICLRSCNHVIDSVSSIKYLDVVIDVRIMFENHLIETEKKLFLQRFTNTFTNTKQN